MTHGSLFTGIGGIDLGFEWAGIETKWQVEIDDYCRELLDLRFPHTKKFKDVKKVGKYNLEQVDIISGGFPCPAFSVAGKRGGFQQDDLFFEMIRICDECKPAAIIFENVQGFTKWQEILHKEVETIGYDWGDAIFDARDFGVPTSRRRYFAICIRKGVSNIKNNMDKVRGQTKNLYGILSNTNNAERRWSYSIRTKQEWQNIYDKSTISREDHGIPKRVDRLKGIGNAVVPQIPYIIGKRLMEL